VSDPPVIEVDRLRREFSVTRRDPHSSPSSCWPGSSRSPSSGSSRRRRSWDARARFRSHRCWPTARRSWASGCSSPRSAPGEGHPPSPQHRDV